VTERQNQERSAVILASLDFLVETEMPGIKIDLDQRQIICHRYFFASKFVHGMKVLEVCCGPGLSLGYLSRGAKLIVGGDITKESLMQAQNHYKGRIGLIHMDAHKLPFKNGAFDTVICVAAIIYLELPTFMEECYRVLKKDGRLILNTPNKDIPNFRRSRQSKNYYSVPELSALLKQQHFDAEFLGAFPVAKARTSRMKITFSIWKTRLFNLLSKVEVIRRIGSYILNTRSLVLADEIDEEMMKKSAVGNIPLIPLPSDSSDSQHRIVYIVAIRTRAEI